MTTKKFREPNKISIAAESRKGVKPHLLIVQEMVDKKKKMNKNE